MWAKTCEETLGHKKVQHKPYITARALQNVDERKRKKEILNNSCTRTLKVTHQQIYTKANKKVKAGFRRDKRNYTENLATRAEQAASKRNMKELHNTTKKLTGKYNKANK